MENAFDASHSAGLVNIGIEELSKIIGFSEASIAKWASTNPEKLPPRFKTGTSSVRWLLADVWVWLQQHRAETPAPAVQPAPPRAEGTPTPAIPSTPPVRPGKRRGRKPDAIVKAARLAGMSTNDYIASMQGV